MNFIFSLLDRLAPNCKDGRLALDNDYSSEARYREREHARRFSSTVWWFQRQPKAVPVRMK